MHCRGCGAPSYQDPCATCVGKSRTETEKAGGQAAVSNVIPPNAIRSLLHHLWTKSIGGHNYDKREWEILEAGLAAVYTQLRIDWMSLPGPAPGPEDPTVPIAPAPGPIAVAPVSTPQS